MNVIVDDEGIIRRFPFPVTTYKGDFDISRALAYMNEEASTVWWLFLYKEVLVPLNAHCFSYMGELLAKNTLSPQ